MIHTDLNRWIAEHIMGWKVLKSTYRGEGACLKEHRIRYNLLPPHLHLSNDDWLREEPENNITENDVISHGIPDYCGKREHAMEVLEKCIDNGYTPTISRRCYSDYNGAEMYGVKDEFSEIFDIGETLPLAICRFAKKTLEQ